MDKQSDLISRCQNEADLCRNDGASDIAAPWRLLTRADTIRRGDQGLDDNCETWSEVVPFVCGMPYVPGFFMPIRRAMPGCTTPDNCRGRDGCSGECKTRPALLSR